MSDGQMTAGSWISIGTQGILQGTYETFGACARKHFGGSLRGRLVLSAGLGGMARRPAPCRHHERGRRPLRRDRPRSHRSAASAVLYVDRATDSIDEALGWAEDARRRGEALSIALLRQRRRGASGACTAGIRPRCGHRSDIGADMLNGMSRRQTRRRPRRAARQSAIDPMTTWRAPGIARARVSAQRRGPPRLWQQHPARGGGRGQR